MTTLTLRVDKGSPLTHTELDNNFKALDSGKTDKSANLSDVASAATALQNLGGIAASTRGAANGVATLDSNGFIPLGQINGFVSLVAVGAANGVAPLNAAGKIPSAFLSNAVLLTAVGAASGVAPLGANSKIPDTYISSTFATAASVTAAISALNATLATQISTNKVLTPQVGAVDGSQTIYFDSTYNCPILEVKGFKFKFVDGFMQCINKTKQITALYTTSAAGTFVVPAGVYFIFVKMWGAGGGGGNYGNWNHGGRGGGGGYSHALIPVVPGETITYRVGQGGLARSTGTKAYPDGGGSANATTDTNYAAGGGGSTSISVPSLGGYVLWAGAGGGGGACNGWPWAQGGAGGGLCGERGFYDESYSTTVNVGGGGTQTAGGAAGIGGSTNGGAGSAGQGGTHQSSQSYGGGGGGGYYGGGSGCYGTSQMMGGGGGGSGYAAPSLFMSLLVGGSGYSPGRAGDPDLSIMNGAIQPVATGGEDNCHGGSGLIVIYY